MNINLATLPSDVDTLHRLVRDLAAQVAGDQTELAQAQAEIQRLRLIIQRLQRSQFGRQSERIDGDQLALGLEDLDADLARAQASHAAISPTQTDPEATPPHHRLPEHLPREDVAIDVEERVCPCCGGALHTIGETVSEMLDFVPARLRVLRIRRPKYGCRACGTIHQAPAPDRPIAKGMASPGLLAHVLVSKYCDHTPLYRQTQIFARHGVEIDRSTLANWVGAHLNNVELGRHGRSRSNVWRYEGANTFRKGRMEDLKAHPTVKPITMIADALKDCTRRDQIVLDTFCGSGTTILAAERVGRRARGMEIDPHYVDVAIRRWQAFTGRDAIQVNTGLTFDELAAKPPDDASGLPGRVAQG